MAIDTLFTDPARRCYSALCRAVASRATGMERGAHTRSTLSLYLALPPSPPVLTAQPAQHTHSA